MNFLNTLSIATTGSLQRFTYLQRHLMPANVHATSALVTVEGTPGDGIRYTLGNSRLFFNPATGSFGHKLAVGESITLTSPAEIAGFTFIRTGAADVALSVTMYFPPVPGLLLQSYGGTTGMVLRRPRTLAYSSFTAADATLLPNYGPEVGPAWEAISGTWDISGNMARCDTNPKVAAVDVGQSDVTLFGEIHAPTTQGGACALAFHIVDDGNYKIAKLLPKNPNPQFQIQQRVNAVWSDIVKVPLYGATRDELPDFYNIKITLNGDKIRVTLEGQEHLTLEASSPLFTKSTKHGLHYSAGSPGNDFFDFFLCEGSPEAWAQEEI